MNTRLYTDGLIDLNRQMGLKDPRPKENISEKDGPSFKDIVNRELQKVNEKQIEADKLTQDFITGDIEDLHRVLIATEEARLSLELAVQVRNKCIEGFKEINNMQL